MGEEINYGELFGIEAGENETGAADPSGTEASQGEASGAQGAEEQEAADPAGADDNQQTKPEGEQPAGQQAENPEGEAPEGEQNPDGPQPMEERAAFAAARRKAEAERDAAVAKAREDARKAVDEAFASSGMTNPYTGKLIASKAEYDEYRTQFEAEKRERILKQTGMSEEEFRQYVESLPEVRQAKQAQEAAAEAQRQAQEQQAEAKVTEQLKEIGALDPSIRTLEDLGRMPNYPEFYERVRRGMTLTEAFMLTNYDALTKGAAAASRQAALNSAQSTEHLTTTSPRGAGAVTVPSDVLEQYRALNPGATDAEIQAHYNRSHKAGKK